MGRATTMQSQAVRVARLEDALDASFARTLGGVLKRLTGQVRVLTGRLAVGKDGRLVTDAANLARVLRLRTDLGAALTKAGYARAATAAVDAPLDALARTVLLGNRLAQQAAALTPIDIDALAAFKSLRLADLLEVGDDLGRALWRTSVDGVLGSRPVTRLVDDLAAVADRSARQARTLYDTAVATFGREVDQLHTTGEAGERFLYAGPADGKVRPFCRARVGRIYDRAAIDRMDNGQLPDVLMTAGGYNCRHAWKPVARFDAELHGLAETGQRLPEVDEALRSVVLGAGGS